MLEWSKEMTGAGQDTGAEKRRPLSKSLRFDVFARDGFKCVYCGRGPSVGVTLHADHVKARSRGGPDTLENLVTSCDACNLGKSAKDLPAALPAATKADATFGLSFDKAGQVERQFEIVGRSADAVEVEIFSWATGEANGRETWLKGYVVDQCALFLDQEAFKQAGAYWGDLRADRRNPAFIQA